MSVEDPKGAPSPSSGESSPPHLEDPYGYYDAPYGSSAEPPTAVAPPAVPAAPPRKNPPPPAPPDDGEDPDDEGMLRMSFLEHLEELRSRIIKALMGLGVAFVATLVFANELWRIVSEPATIALRHLGFEEKLAQITPMETFSTVWVKLPMLASLFIASPWVLYQVWAFIAPGLYKRERRWAAPFVICSAGLFILGGLFAYHVAFRFGLEFLLGIGRDINIKPVVSVTEYFDLFVNVTLGIGIVFELPVLIFFLTLLRIVTPSFLIRNARYAILAIVIVAAIVTPTPDVFNLMLFALPMVLLFFVGVFAGYLLTLHRENRRFPWGILALVVLGILGAAAAVVWALVARYGYHILNHWPFLSK
jgi:sec-independent protein translocase protein TatC